MCGNYMRKYGIQFSAQGRELASFFGNGNKVKNFFEIEPPFGAFHK